MEGTQLKMPFDKGFCFLDEMGQCRLGLQLRPPPHLLIK
jgi:hypothetical protein